MNIQTKYCNFCKVTTTWYKDMCMKCQHKEKSPFEEMLNQNPGEQFNKEDISEALKDIFKTSPAH